MNNTRTQTLPASSSSAQVAAEVLRRGGLVAFPTETVYGLGADAANGAAVAALYGAKGRPAFNPLIAHVESLTAGRQFARFNAEALRLAKAFWPGPLTLVLPKSTTCNVSDIATAGLDSIALRVPQHPFARDMLRAFGGAVVAPSANRSGHVSPTNAAHVADDLSGRIDLIVDGGPVSVGLESTIVNCLEEPMLLRPGGITTDALSAVLGRAPLRPDQMSDNASPRAPGMLASHYAPRTPLRLSASKVEPDEALLAFGACVPGTPQASLNLSPERQSRGSRGQSFRLSSRAGCCRRASHSGNADSAIMVWVRPSTIGYVAPPRAEDKLTVRELR